MRNPVIASVNIPSLETERLVLRGHRLEDFSASAAMWADENVTRHILDQPLTEEVAWSRFLRYIGHWAALGFGYWLMEEKHTGRFVGEVGFADYKRGIRDWMGARVRSSWQRLCNGSGTSARSLGRCAFSNADLLHHHAAE